METDVAALVQLVCAKVRQALVTTHSRALSSMLAWEKIRSRTSR